MAACAAFAAPASAAPPIGDGDGGFALTEIGRFERPIHADNAPGTKATRSTSSSRRGVIRVAERGQHAADALPGHQRHRPVLRRGGPALGRLPPRLQEEPPLLRLLQRQRRRPGGDGVQAQEEAEGSWRCARAAVRSCTSPTPSTATTTAARSASGPTGCSTSPRATAAPAGTRPTTPRTPNSCSASCCGSTRGSRAGTSRRSPRRARRRKSDPSPAWASVRTAASSGASPRLLAAQEQPVRRRGRPRRGLRARPAQPVPLHLRLRDRRDRDRRRRPGLPRGDELSDSRAARAGSTSAGRATRGPGSTTHPASCRATVFPIVEYDNTNAAPGCQIGSAFDGVSVIAGFVVRDERLTHQYGRLLYSDAANPQIRSVIPSQGGASDDQSTGLSSPGSVFSFAEGFGNVLYVVDGSGPSTGWTPRERPAPPPRGGRAGGRGRARRRGARGRSRGRGRGADREARQGRRRQGRRRAEAGRPLPAADLRRRGAGRKGRVRGRAARPDQGAAQGQEADLPRHPRRGAAGRRAGPALGRLRSRLPAERIALRLLRQQRRRPRDRGVPAGLRHQRRPLERPAGADDQPPRRVEPQRRPAPVRPRRLPLHRLGRRRGRRRPRRFRPGHLEPARQDPPHRPPPQRRRPLQLARLATRSSATRDATRSTRWGCATRSASASTASRPRGLTSSSATSARTASRRSTTRRSPAPEAPTSAGTTSRATPPSAAPTRPALAPRPADQGLQPGRRRLRADRRLRGRPPRS